MASAKLGHVRYGMELKKLVVCTEFVFTTSHPIGNKNRPDPHMLPLVDTNFPCMLGQVLNMVREKT